MSRTPPETVKSTGAEAQSFLIGVEEEPLNIGLRVQIHRAQKKDRGGRILGSFILKKAGHGTYAEVLEAFVGQTFSTARDFIEKVKRISPHAERCTHLLNCNKLRVDKTQQP